MEFAYNDRMKIRRGTKNDIFSAEKLVCDTFAKCNYNEGSKKSVQGYLDIHDPVKNLKRISEIFEQTEIYFIAVENNKIIGKISGKRFKIGNLYVNPQYHKKGIARKLVERFEKEAKKLGSKEIKIKSSLYAIPFYQKMGYKKTTGIRKMIGLNFQPMKKNI